MVNIMQFVWLKYYIEDYITSFDIINNFTLTVNSKSCLTSIIAIILLTLIRILYQKHLIRKQRHEINFDIFNNLHKAAFENDVINSYKLIMKYPDAINIPHPIDGYTPFMRACLNGSTQLVKLMLNHGADILQKSSKGETPFYLAVFYHVEHPHVKDASCIRTLCHAGSDVNIPNNKGYTPLHLAALFGHTHLTLWLLNKGANTNVQPDPYLLARLQGHAQTAKTLEDRRLPSIE